MFAIQIVAGSHPSQKNDRCESPYTSDMSGTKHHDQQHQRIDVPCNEYIMLLTLPTGNGVTSKEK